MTNQIVLLSESISMVGEICCSKCRKVDNIGGICDDYEAAEYFKREGWHSTAQNIYCPKCNKKRKPKTKTKAMAG